MTKTPRDLTPKEVIRVLIKMKWYHARTGKHQSLYKHPIHKHFIIVPAHDPVKVGTLDGIIEALGLTTEDFIDLL
jgi:predicted RNA binding protein YcfA (HicA-like mRNA interferase family)